MVVERTGFGGVLNCGWPPAVIVRPGVRGAQPGVVGSERFAWEGLDSEVVLSIMNAMWPGSVMGLMGLTNPDK